MHKPSRTSTTLITLVQAFGFAAGPLPVGDRPQRYYIPGGRIYRSRSRYTPAGPNRNCGERGISPKKVRG